MKKLSVLFVLFLILPLFFHSGSASTAYKDLDPISILELDQIPPNIEGQHHILLVCVDQWNANPKNLGNTDGMILLTIDTRAKRSMITTFSRDMLVLRPDGYPGRITYIASRSSPEDLCDVISKHFGILVDKYFIFDMKQVENIIESLGGVHISITDEEAGYLQRYAINLDATKPRISGAGTYLFDGHSSVIYMRIRKVGIKGEIGRTERMRRVLSTVAYDLKNISDKEAMNLLELISLNNLLTNLNFFEMLSWMERALEVKQSPVEGIQMPPDEASKPVTYAGMSVKQVDYELSREILHEFLNASFVVLD